MRRMCRLAMIGLVVASAACSESPNEPTSTNLLTATYDGAPWVATTRQGAWATGQMTITGRDESGRTLTISATNVSASNTYSFAPGNPNALMASWTDPAKGQFSTVFTGTGTLTLTTATLTQVVGTFNFTAGNAAGAGGVPPSVSLQGQFDLFNPPQ